MSDPSPKVTISIVHAGPLTGVYMMRQPLTQKQSKKKIMEMALGHVTTLHHTRIEQGKPSEKPTGGLKVVEQEEWDRVVAMVLCDLGTLIEI